MSRIGLTSVTFRKFTIEQVVEAALKTGMQIIEWGGDIHCPHGDLKKAEFAKKLCKQNGLNINSYGSYYRLSENNDPKTEFKKVIASAKTLEVSIIRVWPGAKASRIVTKEEREKMVQEAKLISDLAAEENMVIGFEYHNDSLTDCSDSALQLMKEVNKDNCRLYWQLDSEISFEENMNGLKKVLDYIICVHVFALSKGYVHEELSTQKEEWKLFYTVLKDRNLPFLLEFVKDGTIENYYKDCETLKEIFNDK